MVNRLQGKGGDEEEEEEEEKEKTRQFSISDSLLFR